MFIAKEMVFLVFFMGLFSSIVYAKNPESLGVSKAPQSSAIPDKREFPVNNAINPCVNFYQYACSSVIASFKLREDRSRHVFSFSDADERLLEFKKKYFLNLAKKTPESTMEGEVKNYYLSCMDKKGRQEEERAYVTATKSTLEKIATREEFVSMVAANIVNASQLSFITFDAQEPNLDHPEYNDLFFDTGLMSLPEKSYYKNKKLVKDLQLLIEQFFIVVGEKNPKQKAKLVVNFEKGLAENYPIPPDIRERLVSRTEVSRETLLKNYPNLKLEKFLSGIPKRVVIRNIIGDNTMKYLDQKLATASLEELKSIFLYFQLKTIMDDAYPEFFAKNFAFNKKYLGGPNKRPDRQERCTNSAMRDFAKEVDFILLPKLFPNFPKEKFVKSIEKIRISLMDQLENNTWLNATTKKEAIRKIKNAKLALVCPDNEKDWDFNPRGDYATDKPIANSYKLKQLLMDKYCQELQGPVNTNRWFMAPLVVNANYSPNYNRFEFPIGVLQYPFYDPNEPEEVNLAAIGAVIGHELGHGIDNHGNRFNADGVFKTWMTTEDKEAFKKRSQYLVAQFNKIGHNGEFTLGENIGDLVGLTTAYNAAFPPGSKKSQELQQKFFLQWARLWCGIERKGVTERRLKIDPHALEYARTNEPIKHQAGFQEAYNCKPGDPMVLPDSERVKVW